MTEKNHAAGAAESPNDVCSAADALQRAKAELEKAQAYYEKVRKQAVEGVEAVRKTSVGDVIDGTLHAVRRHPGASLTVAALLGLLLGRLFRRR
jgi:ElaB/YqjD/DUF883 family membrane-anchored ribosome-binding protein